MGEFIHRESYIHSAAKYRLADWLWMCEAGYPFILPFVWRPGSRGVYTELPFFERSDPYYFELSKNVLDSRADVGRYLFVPDICVFQCGVPVLLIEVVWTNPVTDTKLDLIKRFFNGHAVEVWEVRAEEILRHLGMPRRINAECILRT
jgi:hypothetical protein